MRKIPLSQGKFALVDDEDFEHLSQWNWCIGKCGSKLYAKRGRKLCDPLGYPSSILMHRILLDTDRVDHIDGDGLNNQKLNLRHCTVSQNAWNTGMFKTNTSGYKGVFWHKKSQKWRAQISCQGKTKHLGYFHNKVEAAKCYDEAALRLHGEFAQTNEI